MKWLLSSILAKGGRLIVIKLYCNSIKFIDMIKGCNPSFSLAQLMLQSASDRDCTNKSLDVIDQRSPQYLWGKANTHLTAAQYDEACRLYIKLYQLPESERESWQVSPAMKHVGPLKESAEKTYIKMIADEEVEENLANSLWTSFSGLLASKKSFNMNAYLQKCPFCALMIFGQRYMSSGEMQQSLRCYQKAIQLRPKDNSAYERAGFACLKTNKIKRAIQYLLQALDIKKTKSALNGLGRCYFELGEYQKAEKYYRECLEINSMNIESNKFFYQKSLQQQLAQILQTVGCRVKTLIQESLQSEIPKMDKETKDSDTNPINSLPFIFTCIRKALEDLARQKVIEVFCNQTASLCQESKLSSPQKNFNTQKPSEEEFLLFQAQLQELKQMIELLTLRVSESKEREEGLKDDVEFLQDLVSEHEQEIVYLESLLSDKDALVAEMNQKYADASNDEGSSTLQNIDLFQSRDLQHSSKDIEDRSYTNIKSRQKIDNSFSLNVAFKENQGGQLFQKIQEENQQLHKMVSELKAEINRLESVERQPQAQPSNPVLVHNYYEKPIDYDKVDLQTSIDRQLSQIQKFLMSELHTRAELQEKIEIMQIPLQVLGSERSQNSPHMVQSQSEQMMSLNLMEANEEIESYLKRQEDYEAKITEMAEDIQLFKSLLQKKQQRLREEIQINEALKQKLRCKSTIISSHAEEDSWA